MGAKKTDDPGGLYEELEDYVKDFILQGGEDDPYLSRYILLVLDAERSHTEIFTEGLLDRPAFFERYLRRWIVEGIDELRSVRSIETSRGSAASHSPAT